MCSAECATNGDCTSKCDAGRPGTGCDTGFCTCNWGTNCTLQCGGGGANNWRGTGCSEGYCTWSDCYTECSGKKHYTGCSAGVCTNPVCTAGTCGAECAVAGDCASCSGNQPRTGCNSTCDCTYGTSCTSQCNGAQPGTGCSGGSCTWGTSCTSQCNGAKHYTGCSSGACTGSAACVKGDCGAECAVNSDCPDKCIGSTRYSSGTCNAATCACSYSTTQDCGTTPATDTDGGDVPTVLGTCAFTSGCAGGVCTSGSYPDVCTSGTQLTEYYNSGASCLSKSYICSNFEVSATKVGSTCTPGTAAGCSVNAFATSSGTGGGTDSCVGSCPGGCQYRVYSPFDSGDACSGLDSCTSTNYDPDASSTYCTGCAGSGKWNIGGIANCCGDDSNENVLTRQCDGYACSSSASDNACCDQVSDCVWNDVCYNNGDVLPGVSGATCASGTWRDTAAPFTTINPDGGDYTGSGTTNVPFSLSCSDTGGAGCMNSYYKIVDVSQTCSAGGFTTGSSGAVTCPIGFTCSLKVCYYSNDRAGNVEPIRTSNSFLFGPRVCDLKQCGEACFGVPGVCNGPSPGGSCYGSGGCFLNCAVPSMPPGSERIWASSSCGRAGSYKCEPDSVCGNSLTSCTIGGSPVQVTGNWASYAYPSGSYAVGQAFRIILGGVTRSPAGFTILSECAVVRPDGRMIFFDNWGTDVTYSRTFVAADPEGRWTVDYCSLWSDFSQNRGWLLKEDATDRQFVLDKSPPSITINNPRQNDVYALDFRINATVSDTYSPIGMVQYRWENAVSNGAWTGMSPSGGEYAANFDASSVPDGVYSFRVRANDSVGNANEAVVTNVTIDRQAPDFTILNPTTRWYTSGFTVRANTSGSISAMRYRWENGTSVGQWVAMTRGADNNYTAIFASASVASGNYSVRVWANNSMGIQTNKSVRIGIDYVSPSSQMTLPVPGSSTMSTLFNISWTGSDTHSGVRCNYVVYRYCDSAGSCPATVYNATFPDGACTTLSRYEFNPSAELGIGNVNNFTFFFRSVALDNAGNLEAKSVWETNTTIYLTKLVTFFAVESSTGALVPNGGRISNNRTVKIVVVAKPEVVGNLVKVTVYYSDHALGQRPPAQLSNWRSLSCFNTRECNISVTASASDNESIREVDYVIYAENAGTTELLPPTATSSYFYYLVYHHPLCNFLASDTFSVVMGSGELIPIEVRNIQGRFDTIALSLDNGVARFLENNQQYIQIQLNPSEEMIIYARLLPAPPNQEGIVLTLRGNSTADPILQDEDSIRIFVGFPPDFSELSDLAAVAIVLLAGLIYLKFVKV